MSTKKSLQELVAKREEWASKVNSSLEHWQDMKERVAKLEDVIKKLSNICDCYEHVEDSKLSELKQYLTELRNKMSVSMLNSEVTDGIDRLKILKERFDRKTLNVVVAGVGKCGKSTSLKSILGISQEDNTVISSGGGTAVTATKSVITHVESKDAERTRVVFLTKDAFLDRLNRYLTVSGLDPIRSLDDFERLDVDNLRRELSKKIEDATVRVTQTAAAAQTEGIRKEEYARYNSALAEKERLTKANADVFINKLAPMRQHFADYKHLLGREPFTDVKLAETYRYASYPDDGSTPLCFAVEECQIFYKFPDAIKGFQVVDLPGWGTADPCEEDVFRKGFGYFVDLVLMVRRPEGTQKTAGGTLDSAVVDILNDKLTKELFSDRVYLFQNDAMVENVTATPAEFKNICDRLKEWAADLQIKYCRGDARDQKFMQEELLQTLLDFMDTSLPKVDQELWNMNYVKLDGKAKGIDTALTAIESHLKQLRNGFPTEGDIEVIEEIVDEIRNKVMNEIIDLRTSIQDIVGLNDCTEAITSIHTELKREFENRYNDKSDTVVDNAKNIITRTSVGELAHQELREIRILIRDCYAKAEDAHLKKISKIKQKIADIFISTFPEIFSQNATLESIFQYLKEANMCHLIAEALQSMINLQFPFYSVAWPPIEEKVFGFDHDKYIQENFYAENDSDKIRSALYMLLYYAGDQNNNVCNLMKKHTDMDCIIKSALLRFEDIVVRKKDVKYDWVRFVQAHLSKLQNNKSNAYVHEIRQCLDRI